MLYTIDQESAVREEISATGWSLRGLPGVNSTPPTGDEVVICKPMKYWHTPRALDRLSGKSPRISGDEVFSQTAAVFFLFCWRFLPSLCDQSEGGLGTGFIEKCHREKPHKIFVTDSVTVSTLTDHG